MGAHLGFEKGEGENHLHKLNLEIPGFSRKQYCCVGCQKQERENQQIF